MSTAAADAPKRPQRIVSTNLCTDQMVLRLVEPERIASLTWLSWKDNATPPELRAARDHAKPNHGLAEEVLMQKPDLVVGGTFSARFTNSLLAKLGYPVITLTPEQNFEEWYASVRKLGDAVGEPERAEKIVRDFEDGLTALKAEIGPGEMPVYASLSANNWMPGKDTLYTQVVNAGGFRTAGETLGYSGYRGIPLEQLIRIPVDLISTGDRDDRRPSLAAQGLHHPLLRRMAENAIEAISIPPRYTTCTTPETLEMIRQLVEARKKVDAVKAARKAAAG